MSTSSTRHGWWRRLLGTGKYVLAFLLVPLLVGGLTLGIKLGGGAAVTDRPADVGPFPPPAYDPAKKIAVVVSSAYGMEITDSLPPFEVLGRSGAFNVYVVAPERAPLPAISSQPSDTGLDFVPHFSYAEYERTIGRAPDLILIPWFPSYTPERDAAVLTWIRAHAGPRTTLMSVCAGTEILADTGLLDGHTATTNLGWFDKLGPRFPTVRWVHDVRYVDDGNVITSTNLASGIDATLHAVDKLVGRSTAEDVARQLGYTHTRYLDDPRFQPPGGLSFVAPAVLNIAFGWGDEKLGVVLYDGVSDFALAGLLDPYLASFQARTYLVAPERAPVRSRNGMIYLPRYDVATAPALDRVLLPAGDPTGARDRAVAAWDASDPTRPVEAIHRDVGNGVSAYDATLQDLARTSNAMFARTLGTGLFYPVDGLALPGARWPVAPIVNPLALGLLGIGLVYLVGRAPLRPRLRPRPAAFARQGKLI